MTDVATFIRALRYEIGTTEYPPGSNNNPYSRELGRPPERWCADFAVAMCLRHGVWIPSTAAYTPTLAQGFQVVGRWHQTPEVGDMVFQSHGGKRIDHVEFVTLVQPSLISGLGGNTSSDHAGDQVNGGGVFEKHRNRDKKIVGYGRPQYDIPLIEPEATGMPKVMHWQNAIYLVGYDKDHRAWRRTFPNPSRLAQIIGGGGVQTRADGNAFEVSNDQFLQVYADLGEA